MMKQIKTKPIMPKDLKQVGKKHVDKLHSIKCQSKKD